MQNVLFANIEAGLVSVAHRGDIQKIRISSTETLENMGWDLIKGRWPDIGTVVIDNVTELQTLNLQEIVKNAISSGRNRVQNRERTVDDVWQEDYGKSTKQLARLFRLFRDLPMHVIFTAHMKRVYPKVPEGTDLTKIQPIAVMPSLSAKLGEALMGYVDFVWCLAEDTDKEMNEAGRRFLITVSKGEYRCKTRGPMFSEAIGDVVEDPNMASLYDVFVESSNPPKKKRK